MAAGKQVLDIKPGKGFSKGVSDEIQRNWSEKAWQHAVKHGNYDRSRAHLNFEVGRGGIVCQIDTRLTIPQRIAESLSSRGIKDPNAGREEPYYRTVANIILGGSRERMHEIAFGEQTVDFTHGADNSHITRSEDIEQWAVDMYRFACAKWGEDNVVSCVCHLDELNPHIHLTVLPVINGRISWTGVFSGKDKFEFMRRTSQLHDELAEVNSRWGLTRGESKKVTGARHVPNEEYKRNLAHECTKLENEAATLRDIRNTLREENKLAERRVKGLTTMVANLEDRIAELQEEEEELMQAINEGKQLTVEQQRRLETIRNEKAKAYEALLDKQMKLKTAEMQLAEVNKQLANKQAELKAVNARLVQLSGSVSEQYQMRVESVMLAIILDEFRFHSGYIPPNQSWMFEKTLLKELADAPYEVIKCAALLAVGYIDGATEIAQNCGGGGTTDDRDWGKKPNESDTQWLRRCITRAHKMCAPRSRGFRR